jgi:hypothetical protein
VQLVVALVLVAGTVHADRVDPDHVPMAAVLRQAFGKQVWRGNGIELHDVSCRASGGNVACAANDHGRMLHASGTNAGAVIQELASFTGGVDVASIICRSTRCAVEVRDGDWHLMTTLERFEMDSLCEHTRTMSSIPIRCTAAGCTLGPAPMMDGTTGSVAIAGNDADAIARVLARRLDRACGGSACTIAAQVECESSGCAGDGGLTSLTSCDVKP